MKELIEHNGEVVVDNYCDADIVVVNSCAVTQPAERDVYKFIRRVYRESKKTKKIFLVGCYADYIKMNRLENEFFKRLSVDFNVEFFGNNMKYKFIGDFCGENQIITKFFGHTRAYVKIQDGCNNFCSYCIVPYLRNKLYSKPKDLVLKEVEGLVKNGYKEIFLVGTNIGKYFYFDREKKYDFVDLSEEILLNFDEVILIYTSLEVVDLNDKFFEFLKKYKTRIFPHFHIPLQSADDKVLADMGREYDTSFYSQKINLLRKIYPEVIISCDLIVGYPLETYESFLKTLEFIEKTKFNWVHVFPYSPRKSTESYKKYGDFVCYDVKKRVRTITQLNSLFGEEHFKKICKVI
jgi:threonylcarbamoyladenosine tRNA methylthiotransferase MtaB